MSACHKNRCRGEANILKDPDGLYGMECVPIQGGHKTIGVPEYVLTITNPPGACILFDDDASPLQEDTGETICLDEI